MPGCSRIGFEPLSPKDTGQSDTSDAGGVMTDADFSPFIPMDADTITEGSSADAPEYGQVAAPAMNPPGGTYDSDKNVTITRPTNG